MEKNWRAEGKTSTVKNQSPYQTCAAHGIVGMIESAMIIKNGVNIQLSEADVYYCGLLLPSEVMGGSTAKYILNNAKKKGVVIEELFPYGSHLVGGLPTCYIDSERDNNSYRINSYNALRSIDAVRDWLVNKGTVAGVSFPYTDWIGINGMVPYIQSPESTPIGAHFIEIVGFSDIENCWIIKNSWGTSWGDAGYAKITYGQSGIFTGMFTAYGTTDIIPYVYRTMIDQKYIYIPALGTATKIYIITKEAVTLSKTQSWLTLSATSMSANTVVSLSSTVNAGAKARFDTITLKNAANEVVSTCIVKQGGTYT